MAFEDLFSGKEAVDNPDIGKATPIDQVQNSDGSVTTYWSDGSSSSTTPTQGAQNVQTSSPDFATQVKNLFTGNSSLGTAGQIGSIAGLLGLLSNMNNSSGYAGYKGGIPSLTGSRQQYATPQMRAGYYVPNLPSNATVAQKAGAITQDQLADYLKNANASDTQIANQLNRYGITPANLTGITGIDQGAIQQRYNQVMGPNTQLGAYRPGQGGITYFSPMQYQTKAAPVTPTATDTTSTVNSARGGLMNTYNTGGIASLGAYSDGGQLLRGPGDGVSDSIPAVIGNKQPARLADGEFVVPARIVSELGNGSTESGARKLYGMMDRIKKSRAKAKNIAADTKSDKYLPA